MEEVAKEYKVPLLFPTRPEVRAVVMVPVLLIENKVVVAVFVVEPIANSVVVAPVQPKPADGVMIERRADGDVEPMPTSPAESNIVRFTQ
jgi:hypothetical protein